MGAEDIEGFQGHRGVRGWETQGALGGRWPGGHWGGAVAKPRGDWDSKELWGAGG